MTAYHERRERAQQALSEGRARLLHLQATAAALEIELSSLQQQCAALQGRLQEGRLGSYETAALQKELEPLLPRRAQVEEQLLAAMLETEELEPQLGPWQVLLDDVESDLVQAEMEERERLHDLDTRLGDLDAARQMLLAQLGPPLAGQYEDARSKHPLPVSEGRNGRCGRCRMGLTDQEIRQLRLGEAQLCTECGSLLVASLV